MFFKRHAREKVNPDLPGSLKPRGRRKIWKYVILAVFVIIVSTASWVGYSGWNAIKNVTADSNGSHSFWNFLRNWGAKKLSGENEDRINVLIIGIGGKNHPGGELADTVMVASIKPGEKKAAFLSIPRDLYVPISGDSYGKINSAHSYGETNKATTGGGPAVMKKTVSDILDIPIHYYIKGDFEGFKDFVDKVGGIDVYVNNAIYDTAYPNDTMTGYSTFYISKGQHHLDGATALKYARSRHTSSDFDRARRQQQILVALKKKAFGLGILANPKKVVDIFNVVGDHIRTDMSIQEIERMVQLCRDIEEKNIRQVVLDSGKNGVLVSSSGRDGYYLRPRTGDFKEIQAIAKNIFSQGTGSMEGASIQIKNGSGSAGQALQVTLQLKSFGYQAEAYMQKITPVAETVIYDYTGGKKQFTAEFLKNYFNARQETVEQVNPEKDFVVILGSDYLINKNNNY